jgi:hypothetical protein
MIDHSRRTGAAIEAHYQFLVWLMPTVGKFPRSHKFTLGDRIEAVALDVVGCAKSPARRYQRARRRGDFAHAVGLSGLLREPP